MKVIFYEREDGERPVLTFLLSLDLKMRVKIIGAIRLLEERGHLIHEPNSKKLDDHIFELRVKQGSDIVRVLYFYAKGNEACLTNGFVKKQDKTPYREIEKANRYRDDWYRRRKDEFYEKDRSE